jgi:hypothetical protein
MLKSQMIGILLVAGLLSCQKKSSPGSGGSGPNIDNETTDEGSKSGSTDDGSEIAIVNLTADLGACNNSRRGKSYYVLAEKKFRYCADSDQWDVIDLKGSDGRSGAAGKNSLVLTTPEVAGANCATGGQKIQSGLDQNNNGQLDGAEVTATSFACNGLVGATGASGAMGAAGPNGSNGKNSLVKLSSESVGLNCQLGGKKVEVGHDMNSNGVLDAGEVSQTSYVCEEGNLPRLRFTRATVAWDASDAIKSATCTTEFGDRYTGASELDISIAMPPIVTSKFHVVGTSGAGYIEAQYNKDQYYFLAGSQAARQMACILKRYPIRFTAGKYASSELTVNDLDNHCVAEFGSGFQAATSLEVVGFMNRVQTSGFITAEGGVTNVYYVNQYGDYALSDNVPSTVPRPIACIVKTL